jgi:abortive infection bacteriophage resistance protein
MTADKRHHPEWHQPVRVDNRRVFAILTILNYLLAYITPQTKWHRRLMGLLQVYAEIPIGNMGFPKQWQESPLWR